jgi:hypothetical protein
VVALLSFDFSQEVVDVTEECRRLVAVDGVAAVGDKR